MRVDLFGVFLLETEYHLNGGEGRRAVIKRAYELLGGCDGKLGGIFELLLRQPCTVQARMTTYNMSHGFLAVNILLHHAILVDAHCGQHVKRVTITWLDSIKYQTNHNFLPSWTSFIPEFRFLDIYNISDILHHPMQRTCSEHFVFIVVCDSNEKLRMSVVHGRAKIVSIFQCELVRITRSCGIYKKSVIEHDPVLSIDFLHLI